MAPSGRLPITFHQRADPGITREPTGLAELHATEGLPDAGDKTNYGMTGGVAPLAVDYPEGPGSAIAEFTR